MNGTVAACVAGIVAAIALAASAGMSGASTINPCRIGQMRLAIGPLVSEKTQQHTITVSLTNLASAPCELDGYPTIKLSDSRGRVLPYIYSHHGDQMITSAHPKPLHLNARASAFFAFNKNACDIRITAEARTLRVMLPGSQISRSVRILPRDRRIEYCHESDYFRTVTVSPIVSTRGDAFCRLQGPCGP